MRISPLLVAALAVTQVAWTQYFTSTGAPVRWNRAEIVVLTDSRGTDDVPGDLEFQAVVRSMETWNAVACSHPLFVDGGRVSGVKPGPKTGKNLLIWWDDPADWSSPEMDHVIALTTLYYDDRSGIVAKFDMEFADFGYQFTVTDVQALTRTDLENTVTHEFGHVLGLDHSKDPEATMYYVAAPGDTDKRTLAQDDITGLCAVYFDWPASDADQTSAVEGGLLVEGSSSGGGCSAGPRGVPGSLWLMAILVVALVRAGRGPRPWLLVAVLAVLAPGWTPVAEEDGVPVRWKVPAIHLSFNAAGTQDILGDEEFEVLKTSMAVWNEVPCGQPRLVPGNLIEVVQDSSQEYLWDIVSFEPADEFDDRFVIAYALLDYDLSVGELKHCRVYFNDDKYFFTTSSFDVQTDLGSIAVHEFGHVLGLGHSHLPKATMYAFYFEGTTFPRDLHNDDATGLCAIYGGNLPEGWTSSWPWEDPPSPLECEDGCEPIPTGLPTIQRTWPKYEVSGRRGCSSGGDGAGVGIGLLFAMVAVIRSCRGLI